MRARASCVILTLLVAAAPLAAQAPALATAADSTPAPADSVFRAASLAEMPLATSGAPTSGAPMTGLRAGVHARETARPAQPLVAAPPANLGQARAMMVVGVAGLIAGAIIGDTPGTIIMVGGTVIGLIGLYEYLQ